MDTLPMTSLAELLDPDQWIVSGKNLSDFPWPDGNNEREAMKLILPRDLHLRPMSSDGPSG
jgi:hypothetical protein